VAFGDLAAARAAITAETAAILVEPVQGEGGINPAPEGFLQGLRRLCDEFNLLLFFDEVQCGIGRTGRLFAHQWTDVAPDVIALAKGLGGGFPVGACLAAGKAATTLTAGSHGSTFGGNPLAMAVANAVLDVILADGFLDAVAASGAALKSRLSRLPARFPAVIAEVRGLGLMLGLKCVVPNRLMVERLMAEGLLTVPAADNVVRLLPPLIIEDAEIEAAASMIERACVASREMAA
jgi:acetylornithine/N-succinyldiaminopimelate aminotransferase